MKKNIKRVFNIIFLLIMCNPIFVLADSGLDSNYEQSKSVGEAIFSAISSLLSFLGELLSSQPGDENYATYHIVLAIICILTIFIITCVDVFKLSKKQKSVKNNIILVLISLVPTILISLLCFLTYLQLILYIFVTILYVIIISITTKVTLKRRLKKQLLKLKEIDAYFNEEDFNEKAFNIYKDIQYCWMNNDLNKMKKLISEDIYNKYKEQLKELDTNKQKNIMDRIEFKSNKITDIKIDNNNAIITCEMKVTCIDYIIDDKEEVVKGKSDKVYNYTYKLVFNKNIKDKTIILIEKKMKSIK